MKVIKKGTPWTKEFECTGFGNGVIGCHAKLLVSQGDLYQTTREFMDGDTSYYNTFMCPVCGAETDVKVDSSVKLLGTKPSQAQKNALVKAFNQPRIKRERYIPRDER